MNANRRGLLILSKLASIISSFSFFFFFFFSIRLVGTLFEEHILYLLEFAQLVVNRLILIRYLRKIRKESS